MESNTSSPILDNAEAKAAFRKPSNDTGSRHYRRRSPVGESSSPEKHERRSSPIPSREASRRNTSSMRRMDEEWDLDRDSGRSHHGRSGDKYRQSDRHSSRSSYDNNRLDNYNRRDKFMDEEERHYSKSSFHSGRESRFGSRYDHARKENEHYKSRHHSHGDGKYSRDRTDGSGHRSMDKDRDERKDYRRGDKKNDRSPVYDSGLLRDKVGHRLSEMSKSDPEELVGQKYVKEEKRKLIDKETSLQMDRSDTQPREQLKERSVFASGNEDSPAKKQKPLSLGDGYNKDADGGKCLQRALEPAEKVNTEQDPASGCTAADIDAARITALKAAESVNKNLMGTGYMSADQKKKLLWGNKKSTPAEEQSSHRWETVTFSDREQQEKFNKLMSLRLHWYIWPIVGSEGRSKSGSQTRQSTEQRGQHREAEGSAARLGEAIHCWPSSERWSHCWTRSVTVVAASGCFCSCTLTLSMLFYFDKILLFEAIDFGFGRNKHAVWLLFHLLD